MVLCVIYRDVFSLDFLLKVGGNVSQRKLVMSEALSFLLLFHYPLVEGDSAGYS